MTISNDDVSLTWSLDKEGDGLVLEYQLTNKLDRAIVVADRMIAHRNGERRLVPERVIVATGSAAGVVRFVRGHLDPDSHELPHAPGVGRLEAGATRNGSARIKLPLKGWHNYSTPPEIPNNPTAAELEIAYLVFDGEPPELVLTKTTDGDLVDIAPFNLYNTRGRSIVTPPRPLP